MTKLMGKTHRGKSPLGEISSRGAHGRSELWFIEQAPTKPAQLFGVIA